MTSLDDLLQLALGHPCQCDAVMVSEIDHRVAVCVGRDQRLQLLDSLGVGKVVKLERVLLGVKVGDRVSADTRGEQEMIVSWATDRHRNRLSGCAIPAVRLSVGNGYIV